MKDRHELLVGSIGVFPEEEDAYWRVIEFSWILPTIILGGGFIDLLLIIIYMKTHPWKEILSDTMPEEELKGCAPFKHYDLE